MVGRSAIATARDPLARARRSEMAWVVITVPVALVIATWLAIVAALTAAGYLLPVRDASAPTDAVVVLGGFGVPRAEVGAQLLEAGRAPVAIASGMGDCGTIEQTLVANGVSPDAIEIECASRSTYENAEATVAILRRRGLRSATLVTHWFHSRRAAATFEAAAPDIVFLSVSVSPPGEPPWRLGWSSEPKAVLAEYVKIAWYALAHGVFTPIATELRLGPGS